MVLRVFLGFAALLLAGCAPAQQLLTGPASKNGNTIRATFTAPDGHSYSSEIFHPEKSGQYPLIIFSHGNFASPDRYHKLLKPIAAAGYIIIAPTHLDAEILALDPKPIPERIWETRNREVAHLGSIPNALSERLEQNGITIDRNLTVAMGHSYGALIAQLAAGAIASDPDGARPNRKLAGIDALIAFSPPGPLPKTIDAAGWSSIDVPSLTVTGTADILPGFIDDWRLHKAGYDATPEGARWLWVGTGIDHYFGGSFGREKPVALKTQKLFDHAVGTTIRFLDWTLKNGSSSTPLATLADVELTKD